MRPRRTLRIRRFKIARWDLSSEPQSIADIMPGFLEQVVQRVSAALDEIGARRGDCDEEESRLWDSWNDSQEGGEHERAAT